MSVANLSSSEAGVGGLSSKRPTPELVVPKHFDYAKVRFVACGHVVVGWMVVYAVYGTWCIRCYTLYTV